MGNFFFLVLALFLSFSSYNRYRQIEGMSLKSEFLTSSEMLRIASMFGPLKRSRMHG